jgi:hypothetical protein
LNRWAALEQLALQSIEPAQRFARFVPPFVCPGGKAVVHRVELLGSVDHTGVIAWVLGQYVDQEHLAELVGFTHEVWVKGPDKGAPHDGWDHLGYLQEKS